MSEWKPMETAPKDGTVVLLAIGLETMPGYYDDGLDSEGQPAEEASWYWFDQHETGPTDPALWMPLPRPPLNS